MAAAAGWLHADTALKREELRLLELGTYARGYEDGSGDVKEQFGIEGTFIEVGDDGDEED